MKLRITSTIRLYLFIGAIALLLTLAVRPLVPDWFEMFKVKIEKDRHSIPNPNIVYHDFDHDGNSELLALKYQEDLKQSAAKIYSANGGLVDQWTFCERWINRSFAFGDFDNDGIDETYIFTQKRDSVFLYAFQPQERGFFIYRFFVDKIAHRNPQGFWDVQIMPGNFIDCDNDGYSDFIFGIMAGLSLQPRRYYAFSPHKKDIIFKSPISYAYIISPQLADVDRDGRPEILNKGGYATGNVKRNSVGYPDDHHAYLFVMDKQLHFKFTPFQFGARGSQIQILPAPDYMPGTILIMHNYNGSRDIPSSLLLLDRKGKIHLRRILDNHHSWSLLKMYRPEGERIFLYNNKGYFEELDARLGSENKIVLPSSIGEIIGSFDLDGDFNKEWILRDKGKITILRSDFSDKTSFDIPLKNGSVLLSIKKQNGQQPLLSLQTGSECFLISYRKNLLFHFRYAIYAVLFALIFTFLYLLFHFINYFISYSDTLNHLIRNPQRGILLLDAKGHIIRFNQTLLQQLQITQTELKGKKYSDIFDHVPAVKNFISRAIESLNTQSEDVIISGDSITFRGKIFIRPVSGLLRYRIGFYFEAIDFAAPIQNDRLKVWSKTVQKMAHDIKTPLSSISINLSMVKQKLTDHAPQALEFVGEDIDIMLGEMNRVREMTKNFLKFTNLEKPNFQTFSLSSFLYEIAQDFNSYFTETMQLKMEINYEMDIIRADRAQLKMVIHALLENAIDAVKGNGMVGISVNQIQKIDQLFEDFIEIEIFDNGPGIPLEIKDRLFEPYFTTKPEGTGMGLAIAKKIIEDHNGVIELVSSQNFSTVFRIMFPIGNIFE